MIIDTHTHMGKGEMLYDTYQIDQSVDAIIATMDEAGVDKSCVMPVTYADYELALEEVREAVAAHPDRLIGFARVNAADEDRALSQLRRAFEDYDFRGLKVHTGMGDGFPTRRLMEALSEYQRPLLLHTTTDMKYIDGAVHLARGYPKVPVILGHMGAFNVIWPGHMKLCAVEAQRIDNLYLDTAFVLLHQWIGMAVEICGPEKVLFASDGPAMHPAIALKQIELCHFTERQRALILGENAAKLLGL